MSITKMSLVDIKGSKETLDEVLLRCIGLGNFSPQPAAQLSRYSKGTSCAEVGNPWTKSLEKLEKIKNLSGLPLAYENFSGLDVENTEEYIDEILEKLTQFSIAKEAKNKTNGIIEDNYLAFHYGVLANSSLEELEAMSNKPFLFIPLEKSPKETKGIYMTPSAEEQEIEGMFLSNGFEEEELPELIAANPEQMLGDEIPLLRKKAEDEAAALVKAREDLLIAERQRLFMVYSKVLALNKAFDLRHYAVLLRNNFHLVGFVPEKEAAQFTLQMQMIDTVEVTLAPAEREEKLKIPTQLKNNSFVKPFEMFVDMYGLPSYHEIDPTPFVAVSYMILFGIMFGDLGQGLVLSLIGWLLSRKNGSNFGKIMIRIGISSACFGVLYGSVFGLENLLDPLYINVLGLSQKPIHVMDPDTINVLIIAAIGMGVVMITASMVMNVVLGIKQKSYERALFSHNGIAGLVLYLGSIIGGLSVFMGRSIMTTPYIVAIVVVPLLLIFLKNPLGKLAKGKKDLMPEEGIGGFVTENFFELFEVILSYATNTMSFLRVGGFIISHAGMMAVVMTLTEMMNGAGSIVALVIGNLFVMGLEGFIVGIAGLRLEFYEMFSRYFDGEGVPYSPVTVNEE